MLIQLKYSPVVNIVLLLAAFAVLSPAAGCSPRSFPTPNTVAKNETAAPTEPPQPASTGAKTAVPIVSLPTAMQTPSAPGSSPAACSLVPIVQPTMPATIPAYTKLDESSGLHMTGHPLVVNLATYRFKVRGLVDHPLDLGLDDLRCMPKVSARPTLICPGFFEDIATWSGVPLKFILEKAGIQSGAQWLKLVSADEYSTSIAMPTALKDENFLAYELNGQPLPVLHGFPLRAIFPSEVGGEWVKWLVEIRVE